MQAVDGDASLLSPDNEKICIVHVVVMVTVRCTFIGWIRHRH